LTNAGFHPHGERRKDEQLELSYELPDIELLEVESFLNYLAAIGTSHDVLRHRLSDIGRTN
jgi:hypothetical protein